MDTALPPSVTKKRRIKRILFGTLITAGLGITFWITWGFLTPSISRSTITTAVAGRGNMENTISASGEVLPEFEETLTSAIDCGIRKVLKDEGAQVKPGESILQLDKSQTQAELEKLTFGLASKRGDIDRLRVDLNQSYSDIQSNNAIKQLNIGSLTDAVENAKRLFEAGGGTREDIEQAELKLKIAQEEKKQLESQIRSKQQTMQLDIKAAELAAQIQESDLHALERKLKLADVTATRKGVITYVDKNIGTSVKAGETLARIADLSSFKVSGSVSDTYLDQLKAGMAAIIRINDSLLRGHVNNIYPSVQGGIVSFDISLDQPNNTQLRPNLKVDVFLVTATHNDVVRVANGPAFKGGKTQDIFILKNGKAYRRTVRIGLTSFEYVEVQDGLLPGDTVINADMSDYKNTKQIDVTH